MSTTRLLTAGAVLVSALALTACDPTGGTSGNAVGPAPTATRTAFGGATPSAAAGQGTQSNGNAPGAIPSGFTACPAPPDDAKYTILAADSATTTSFVAHRTVHDCKIGAPTSDTGYYDALDGTKTYRIAANAEIALVDGPDTSHTRRVDVATLVKHINDCESRKVATPPFSCHDYYYTLFNSSGEATYITEF